jgi:hypothetical protein
VSFPALRYLLRTEKEHARRIRFRQLLLLLLRMAAVLAIVLAAARFFIPGSSGPGHDPAAVAIVLDNSMSSGLVIGEERVLDEMKRLALAGLEQASPDDRFWVIRVGEPWDAAPPGRAADALARVAATDVSTGSGNVADALSRARELLQSSGYAAREIHLFSDLQATGFPRTSEDAPAGEVPVVVFRPERQVPANRYLHDVMVGGGLPPLAGQRTDVFVTIGTTDSGDRSEVPLRLLIDGRMQGASSALPGRAVDLPVGPFAAGSVAGVVETDPDALRADDSRPFAFRVRPPPRVGLAGSAFFLEQALSVLESGRRLVRSDAASANIVFSGGGEGLEGARAAQAVVVVPPLDATLLPALNRRLANAGIPWQYERSEISEGETGENRTPVDLTGVRVHSRYALEPSSGVDESEVVVRLSDGSPWIAAGVSARGPYVILASPLDPSATTLPVSAAMVPLLEWINSLGATDAGARTPEAGEPLALPAGADAVLSPDGTRHPTDGTLAFRETRGAGIYSVLAGDSVLEHVAVAPPVRESLLEPIGEDDLDARIGSEVTTVDDPSEWSRGIFMTRQGPELWRPLLAAALILLVLEAWVAASGRTSEQREGGVPQEGRQPGVRTA